ncbi:class I SAM-dependent methyltransferase [soil metagenome]
MSLRSALLALSGALAVTVPAAVVMVAPAAAVAASKDAALVAVVASPDRPEGDRKRDGYRHPVESLQFWGLKPGAVVVDLQPGGGYWTAILAPYAAKTHGRYIAGGSERGRAGFTGKFADTAKYGTVEYAVFGKDSAAFAPAGTVDVVLTSRAIHNWMGASMLDKGMADSFAALKPGGVLAVEEHRADGSKAPVDGSAGYVPTSTVVAAAEKAGFKLAAKSEINANPKDTKDHPFGVWTLPPSRQSSKDGKPDAAFDHAKYDAIGESDRMTLRFVKPKA